MEPSVAKLKNDKGNGFANPPDNFSPEIIVEKERKSAFVKSCMIEIEDHEMYHNWKNDRPPTCHLFFEPGRIRVTFTCLGYSANIRF